MSRPRTKRRERVTGGHTTSFWNKKWKEYNKFIDQQMKDGKVVVHTYNTKKRYIDAYITAKKEAEMGEGPNNITQRLEWESLWNTKIKVAYGFKEQLTDLGIQDVSVKELRRMRHQDILDKYETQIKQVYENLKSQGMKSSEAGKIISANWFRSP